MFIEQLTLLIKKNFRFLAYKHSINKNELNDFDPFRALIQQIWYIDNEHVVFLLNKDVYLRKERGILGLIEPHTRNNRHYHLNRHQRRRLINDLLNKKRPKKPIVNENWQAIGIAKLDLNNLTFEFVSMRSLVNLPKNFQFYKSINNQIKIDEDFGMLLQKSFHPDSELVLQICRLNKQHNLEIGKTFRNFDRTNYIHCYDGKVFDFKNTTSFSMNQLDIQKIFVFDLNRNLEDKWKSIDLQLDEESGMCDRFVENVRVLSYYISCGVLK